MTVEPILGCALLGCLLAGCLPVELGEAVTALRSGRVNSSALAERLPGFDDALTSFAGELRSGKEGHGPVYRWKTPTAGSLRIVGSLRKVTAGSPAELRALAGGEMLWSISLSEGDCICHGFDITALDLAAATPVEFILLTDAQELVVESAFEIIPEPYVSRWSPDLPGGCPQWSEAEKVALRSRGQAALQSIREASRTGKKQVIIPPGDYLFDAEWSRRSTLKGINGVEIVADGVTFWFEPPMIHALLFLNCRNVTVRGLTIDFTVPIFSQARITAIDREKSSIRAELMKGYEPRNEMGENEISGERKLIFYDAQGCFINHRHTRSDWRLVDKGRSILYEKTRVNPLPEKLRIGDYVVSPIQTGAAIRSKKCSRMCFEDVKVWASPGMAVNESFGEGGNVYRRVRATRRPRTNRLQAFGADIFHMEATDHGPLLERCEAAYGADDTLNIHGKFGRVVKRIDDTHYYLQGAYAVGDCLEFRDSSTVALLGVVKVLAVKKTPDGPEQTINEKYSVKGEFLVELQKPLNLPRLAFVVMDGKCSADGFVVRDCWFHDDFQRTLINGSPNGLIENTTLQNVGHGICVQFETWGPWMEGPFARNLVVRNNRFLDSPPRGDVITVAMHPAGGGSNRRRFAARPVRNMTIAGNSFSRTEGIPLSVHNVDGLQLCSNSVDRAAGSKWFVLQDCTNVNVRANLLQSLAPVDFQRGDRCMRGGAKCCDKQ